MCEGTYKNKSLIGLTIVKNLKNVGQNKYDKGSILDPQSDKTYRFSVTVSPDGENLPLAATLVFLQLAETKHGIELNNP